MIATALFSRSLQKILALLFVRADESFHVNEIMRLTGLGSASVQRELKRLEVADLILSERIGSIRLYRPNKSSPIYVELFSLVQKTFGLHAVLHHALNPLRTQVDLAFIFGSVGRGQESSGSDVDVLLISDRVSYADLLESFAAAERTLARKISPTLYSKAEFMERLRDQNHFLTRVLEQPKIFLIGDDGELGRIAELGAGSQPSNASLAAAY